MAEMTLAELMAAMPTAFVPDKAKGVDAVFQFSASGEGGGDWIVTIRDGKCTVVPGVADSPKATMCSSAADLLGMLTGKLNGTTLFMQGRLKLQGDLGLASRFASFFAQ